MHVKENLPITYLARRWLRARSTAGCCPLRGPMSPLDSCASLRKCLKACSKHIKMYLTHQYMYLEDCPSERNGCSLSSIAIFNSGSNSSYLSWLEHLSSFQKSWQEDVIDSDGGLVTLSWQNLPLLLSSGQGQQMIHRVVSKPLVHSMTAITTGLRESVII